MKPYWRKVYGGIALVARRKPDIKRIKNALQFLKRKSPEDFSFVEKNLRAILIVEGIGWYNEMFAKQGFWVGGEGGIGLSDNKPQSGYLASLLLHEAEHVAQYRKYHRLYIGKKAERPAFLKQRKFLSKIGDEKRVRWLDEQWVSEWWKEYDTDERPIRIAHAFVERYEKGRVPLKDF